jgi:uncharacterized RDD family membrane protein YckC
VAYNPPADASASAYANWGQRVAAALIDAAPIIVGVFVLIILNAIFQSIILGLLLDLLLLAGSIYWWVTNRLLAMGNTGQSMGKRQMRIKLVSEATGQPIGAGQVFVRDIAHILDGFCFIGYLFPLWDPKAQTFADKIMTTVVVPA